jgi:hypothetical protein
MTPSSFRMLSEKASKNGKGISGKVYEMETDAAYPFLFQKVSDTNFLKKLVQNLCI